MKIAFFNSKTGTTLIELMIAILIIATIILGGGMFFFHGRIHTVREARRRAAVLVASQRLEALKAADWDDIAHNPPALGQSYWITYDGSNWGRSLTQVKDTGVKVENLSDGEMLTEARYRDDNGPPDSYDYLEITVTVYWQHHGTIDTVSSTTLIAER